MIYLHVRIDYLCCFYDFPNECRLRIGHIDRAERMFCHCWLLLKVYSTSLEKDSKTSKKYAACSSGTLFPWKNPTPAFSSHCQSWYNCVFILVSQTVWFLSWMLEDFGRFFFIIILNVFRTSLLCIIMLQFKMNHKRTRVLTHVKDRKHLSSKCIFCLSIVLNIRFYIYKMVLYYYNTIFQKNTMSKDLCYQKSSLVWGGWGIFPSFIQELFCHIWLGSNQMQLRFLEGQKNCISACCCGWMKGTIYVFHCHVFHLVSLVHRKT